MLWRFNYLGSGWALIVITSAKYDSIDTDMLPVSCLFVSSKILMIEKQNEKPEFLNDENKTK